MDSIIIGGTEYATRTGTPDAKLSEPVALIPIKVQHRIEARSTAAVRIIDPTDTLQFQKGQTVELKDGATVLFGGFVDVPREHPYPIGTIWTLTCVDWHALADRRLVAALYENTPVEDIVEDLVTDVLSVSGGPLGAEGVTVTPANIMPGPTLETAVFGYVTADRALDALARNAGAIWWIDPDKELHFVNRLAQTGPTVDWSDVQGFDGDSGNRQYRNVQYIKGGTDQTLTQVESFKGDGETRTYSLGYKIAKVPTVKVNTIAETVGIRGLDSGRDWYWNKGDHELTQDSANTPLSASDTLEVTYIGMFDVIAKASDLGEIVRVGALSGVGTGQIEAVADEPRIDSRADAFTDAAGRLARYARDAVVVKGISRTDKGWAPGQLVTVSLPAVGGSPAHRLDGSQLLITGVTAEYGDDPSSYSWELTLADGPDQVTFTDLFQQQFDRTDVFVIRENIAENEVLALLEQVTEAWSWAETINQIVTTCSFPSATTFPSASLYPC